MANDIEKLIEQFVLPEMEVAPEHGHGKKRKATPDRSTVTIDDIPEVVLPKTKAQVYEEAKGRLTQKTSAVSRRAKKSEPQTEVAATQTITKEQSADIHTVEPVVPRSDNPTWVGGADELIPFAWRHPLIADIKRPNKYYRQVVREARALLLPVPHSKFKA